MADQNDRSEYLTLFELDRGRTFTRSGLFFNGRDVAPLAQQAAVIARAERISLSDAAECIAPNVWDEATNHFTCTYDLRTAIVRHLTRKARK